MDERYGFNIGKFHCVAINDGGFVGNAAMLFANAPKDELSQALERYGAAPRFATNSLDLSAHSDRIQYRVD